MSTVPSKNAVMLKPSASVNKNQKFQRAITKNTDKVIDPMTRILFLENDTTDDSSFIWMILRIIGYFLCSSMSPGWQSRALHIASSVENRIAFAFPFFKMEIFAIVIPTFSASSVTPIFRFASKMSMLMMIAIGFLLNHQIVFWFYLFCALQKFLEEGGKCRNDYCGEDNNQAYDCDAGRIIFVCHMQYVWHADRE